MTLEAALEEGGGITGEEGELEELKLRWIWGWLRLSR
jgi:hypothetical protein